MEGKLKKPLLYIALGALACCIVVFAIVIIHDNPRLLSRSDLKNCDLYVNNVTCKEVYEARTVDDPNFFDKAVSLCLETTKFRPVISPDILLGSRSDAFLVFKDDTRKYAIFFFATEKQLSIDYIYRDYPLITIGMAENKGNNAYKDTWIWYCYMSAADYAQLYELTQTYVGGEIVNGY